MEKPVSQKKTLHERQKELQALLTTKEGRAELEELASQYGAASGRIRSARTSLVTYILVHERQEGIISG
jgi:phage-related tail protein